MDVMERLVKNVIEADYKDLPKDAINITKLAILDTLGCIIAGLAAPGCLSLREQVLEWGGKKESTVMLYGDKVPCPNAAFVNGTMARALDFDTTWVRGIHMSAASIPTAIAVAEMCQGVNGKDFLTAIIAGEDLAARIHFATSDYDGFEPTGVCGILGVGAIAGKILSLSERQMLDALAIAFNRAAGSYQPNIDGALMVRVIEGLTSRSGIESALLAKKGISGGENTLQGIYGFFHLFSNDKYDMKILTDKIGTEFLGATETYFKKYPACGGTGSAIDAALQLASETNVRPRDIDEITVDSTQFFYNMLGNPFKIGANPQGSAQFSYQYTVANALVRGRFGIEDIMPEMISDPEVLSIAEKVHPRVNNDLVKEGLGATIVRILTKEGREYFKKVNYRRGSKQVPLSREEIIDKFQYCVGFSAGHLPDGTSERIIRMIDELERVTDMEELIQLMIVRRD
jgi:2-methylcitrate dehydratase PrpD